MLAISNDRVNGARRGIELNYFLVYISTGYVMWNLIKPAGRPEIAFNALV